MEENIKITPPSFKLPDNPLGSSGSLGELVSSPRDSSASIERGVLESMGDYRAGTSVHDIPGGPQTYWTKLEQERPLNDLEKRRRDRGRDQYGYSKEGNEQKKKDFDNNIFR